VMSSTSYLLDSWDVVMKLKRHSSPFVMLSLSIYNGPFFWINPTAVVEFNVINMISTHKRSSYVLQYETK